MGERSSGIIASGRGGGNLFVSQGVDGVEVGGFDRGIQTEKNTDPHGEPERQQDRLQRNDRFQAAHFGCRAGDKNTQPNPDTPAQKTDQDRLNQKLFANLPLLGADGDADADFAGALGHRNQHDVHNADTTYQKGYRGDAAQ